jgi:hypothetical protein
MNRLSIERRAQILAMLTEGNSMRVTARMAACSFNTVSSAGADLLGRDRRTSGLGLEANDHGRRSGPEQAIRTNPARV